MGQISAPMQASFNAGELSPYWAGRVDMSKFGNGAYRLVNFKPIPQGPAVRRMGTRHVAPTKTMTHRSWMTRFVFSEDDSYILEFGDHYVRFYTNNGQLKLSAPAPAWSSVINYGQGALVSRLGITYYAITGSLNQQPPNATYWHPLTGDIYEIWSPYSIADLTNAVDGTFRLSMVQTGDTVFIAHPNYAPQKLIRFSVNNWAIVPTAITNGPFEDIDPDQTITVYSSATTGGVTLTASANIFGPDMLGTLFLLEQKKVDGYKVWEVNKAVLLNDERRSDSNVYQALNAGTTGTVKPTHREGAKFDGSEATAVQWQYLHSGYGIARIDSVSGTSATATVISQIPSQAVGVANASTKWAKSDWRGINGFPSLTTIFRERLCFARGQKLWGSVSGDFENFAARDGAETLPDSSFSITFGTGETNAVAWMVPQDSLLIGTRGAEFSISEVTNSEPFGPGNIKAAEESSYGSRQVPPARVGESTLFVQRSGRRMRDMRYSFNTNGYEATDLMVLSDQIATGQIIQLNFALEPSSTIWGCCANGDFLGLAYQLEQDVVGWHPHRIGGGGGNKGIVESVQVIPSPDGTHDQVWMQVFRVINGAPTRYVEYMERDWRMDEQDIEDAVYSDSASTFSGFVPGGIATILGGITWQPGENGTVTVSGMTLSVGDENDYLVIVSPVDGLEARVKLIAVTSPTTADVTFVTVIPLSLQSAAANNVSFARDVITGLGYLEGEEVTLTVEGAAHPRVTVTGGAITLQAPAAKVQVGLPADAEFISMRMEGGSVNGTAQGKIKRIHQVVYRLHESLGGNAGPEDSTRQFDFRADYMPMDQPPPVFTGDYRQPYDDGYTTEGRIRVFCDQPLPFTLIAIYPQVYVEDRL